MAYPMGRSGCGQWAGLTASRALHPECAPAGRGLCGGTVPGMAGDGHSSESKFSETRTTGSSTTEVKTRKPRLGAARSPGSPVRLLPGAGPGLRLPGRADVLLLEETQAALSSSN